jgi:dihydrofolate reductase
VTAAAPRRIAIVLLAAVADNGVIGRDNGLPFRQSSDLKRFKSLTTGKPVLMGRKTYLSIGKPLPDRTNIVVSRNGGFAAPGVVVAGSLDAALTAARGDALRRGVSRSPMCIRVRRATRTFRRSTAATGVKRRAANIRRVRGTRPLSAT